MFYSNKKNKQSKKDEDEEKQVTAKPQRNSNQIEVNLNIANKLENIWINVIMTITLYLKNKF
jgi:hypothetical protein